MKEQQSEKTLYQTGFNQGYLIAKHMPDLADQLAKLTNKTPQIEGLLDGRKEFMQEKARERLGLKLGKGQKDKGRGKTNQPVKSLKKRDDMERE